MSCAEELPSNSGDDSHARCRSSQVMMSTQCSMTHTSCSSISRFMRSAVACSPAQGQHITAQHSTSQHSTAQGQQQQQQRWTRPTAAGRHTGASSSRLVMRPPNMPANGPPHRLSMRAQAHMRNAPAPNSRRSVQRRATDSRRCRAGSAPGLAAYCSGGWPCAAASVARSKHSVRSAACRHSRRQCLPGAALACCAWCLVCCRDAPRHSWRSVRPGHRQQGTACQARVLSIPESVCRTPQHAQSPSTSALAASGSSCCRTCSASSCAGPALLCTTWRSPSCVHKCVQQRVQLWVSGGLRTQRKLVTVLLLRCSDRGRAQQGGRTCMLCCSCFCAITGEPLAILARCRARCERRAPAATAAPHTAQIWC